MPLSKAKMRERKRRDRGVKPKTNIPGLIMRGNTILGLDKKANLGLTQQNVKPNYNVILDENIIGYDADGYPIYED